MRHYSLVPVRYNDQQLLVRCEPIDAELWSIQWHLDKPPYEMAKIAPDLRLRWFADCAPTEYENAQAIVKWLNAREHVWAATVGLANFTISEEQS